MASIILSFVGNQDPFSKFDDEGPLVSFLRHMLTNRHEISKVMLLYTEGTKKGAFDTRDWMSTELGLDKVAVELVAVSEDLSNDPTDLLKTAQEARRGLDRLQANIGKGDRIEFNASSGTPAMKSAFSLLQAAGYVVNGQVWQVRNPKEMKQGQKHVFETDVSVLRREFELKVLRGQVEAFNYSAAFATLNDANLSGYFPALSGLLKAGEAWQRGEFDAFWRLAKGYFELDGEKNQGEQWWWMAYEQAYTAVVRLRQGNTSEAMQHSFRAVEGTLWIWAVTAFPQEVVERDDQYPLLKPAILNRHPSLRSRYEEQSQRSANVELKGYLLRDLLEAEIAAASGKGFSEYWRTARVARNLLSHRLGGISEQQVLQAWGMDLKTEKAWQQRIIGCLNLLTGKQFGSLETASLFAKLHQKVLIAIASYQP